MQFNNQTNIVCIFFYNERSTSFFNSMISLKFCVLVAFVHEKSATKRLNCALGKEREENCPIDGGWTHWSVWATCKGECGQAGHQLRRRTCTNPTPERGGSTCHGVEIDTRACILPGLKIDSYKGKILLVVCR